MDEDLESHVDKARIDACLHDYMHLISSHLIGELKSLFPLVPVAKTGR